MPHRPGVEGFGEVAGQASSPALNTRLARAKSSLKPPPAAAALGAQRSPVRCGPMTSGDRAKDDQGLRRFFNALAAENFAALLAPIWIVWPVEGLRPCRAARWLTLNLPKPASATSPPAASSSETVSMTVSTTCRA